MACSPHYYRNLLCLKPTPEQMEHIPCARLELMQHVTLKTTQGFGVLGAGVVAPAMTLIKGNPEARCKDFQDRAFAYGKNGILLGLVVGPLMTAAFQPGKSYESIYDRCFRLRHNNGQMRIDRFSLAGLAIGVGACHYIGETLDKGAVFGYLGGFVAGALINKLL